MPSPRVSVVIPTHNDCLFLGEAIQSVLRQTFQDFELIVVNDASTDSTDEVVTSFKDERLTYITHKENRMLAAARNTGIRASRGEFIALLDSDDVFHPQKLQAHVEFMEQHPNVGTTYNARFNVSEQVSRVFELSRAPVTVELPDLVLGFPFAPSDMVLRRKCLFDVGLFDESCTQFGEDLDINCRLALAGVRFAGIDRALNFRRFHPTRVTKRIPDRMQAHFWTLDKVFADPRCPKEVIAMRAKSRANRYSAWACFAFAQGETALGQTCIGQAIELDPCLIEGHSWPLLNLILHFSLRFDSTSWEAQLKKMLYQLPPELGLDSSTLERVISRSYLMRASMELFWGQYDRCSKYFKMAFQAGAKLDAEFSEQLAYDLINYESEWGRETAQRKCDSLLAALKELVSHHDVCELKACLMAGGAFESYRFGQFRAVPRKVLQALMGHPALLMNRGLISILFRSLAKSF